MNATMVASGTKAVPPVVSSIQDIPLGKIRESKTNPRRFFDEAKLAELADNIRQHGVLQPILLRPLPEGEAGIYELVAGTRRYRASKLAKRESIPATVRELTDAQALELQVIECPARGRASARRGAGIRRPRSTSTRCLHRRKHRFASWQIARVRQRTTALDSTHSRSEASVL